MHVNSLALLPTGELACGAGGTVYVIFVLNTTSGATLRVLTGHTDDVTSLVVLPTGELTSGSRDNRIRIWNAWKTASWSKHS